MCPQRNQERYSLLAAGTSPLRKLRKRAQRYGETSTSKPSLAAPLKLCPVQRAEMNAMRVFEAWNLKRTICNQVLCNLLMKTPQQWGARCNPDGENQGYATRRM